MKTIEISKENRRETRRRWVQYTANIHTTGGRDGGTARSSDGRVDIHLVPPDSARPGANPEQLLAIGWSSCFLSAMKLEAEKLDLRLPSGVAIDTEIDLCLTGEAYSLQARLDVSIPGLDPDIARAIVNLAQHTCPYSRALRGSIPVAIHLLPIARHWETSHLSSTAVPAEL